ncbi:hypothetical protein FTUN_1554 [Frigoriglobus tundricola]|uniref:Uncharacterized protein n=1 Tax=Frigoriglobus tundricola TaxID=2774151 RepID=A0A6M5YJ87_9BACT|nr:hypothetical protein FTUN_1554 [Frigoriglobus tundricola]
MPNSSSSRPDVTVVCGRVPAWSTIFSHRLVMPGHAPRT